jgi:GntR family transcriptional regulator, rspAB operon transcriptional repressor
MLVVKDSLECNARKDNALGKATQVLEAAKSSKADAVYGELKEAILSGALEPGGSIDKSTLCERLGVSRFPVSSAISRLAFEKLVVVEPQHGSFVARISMASVRERLFIRRALEGEIAARAATLMNAAYKDALRVNLLDQQHAVDAGDQTTFYALDVAFHRLLTTSLALADCDEILDGLRSHLERVRRMLMAPKGRMQLTVEEHREVALAIMRGDASDARAAMDRHLTAMTETVEIFAREKPDLFSP